VGEPVALTKGQRAALRRLSHLYWTNLSLYGLSRFAPGLRTRKMITTRRVYGDLFGRLTAKGQRQRAVERSRD